MYEQFYMALSAVGHADVADLGSYFSFEEGFFLSPKGVQAEVLIYTLSAMALLFEELALCDWAPSLARRDAKYIARRLALGLCKVELGPQLSSLRAKLRRLAKPR